MEKWTGPLAAPPFWLDKTREITAAQDAPKLPKGAFVVLIITSLIDLGCNIDQALGVAANVMNETAWGRAYRAWNLGGWKITKNTANEADGTPRYWSRALGNKSSGDQQTCFYRAFRSPQEYLAKWLEQFVPRPETNRTSYRRCGEQFWAGEEWFDDLIAYGYKGEVTQRNPLPSMREHAQIVKTLVVMYCQHLLGLTVDGKWGPASRAACTAYQTANQLKPSGQLDKETLDALLHGVKPNKHVASVVPLLAANADPEIEDFEEALTA